MPRPRIGYAHVAATLALVLSMSAGALAAGRYLITSTGQISPQVLHKLTGARGPRGYVGARGAAGKHGAPGAPGARGPAGTAGTRGPQGPTGPAGVARAGPAAAAQNPGPVALPAAQTTSIATLQGLAAGAYALSAKAVVQSTVTVPLTCTLLAGAAKDTETIQAQGSASAPADVVATFQLMHTFASAGAAQLTCQALGANEFTVSSAVVGAIAVSSASETTVSG
jgi:hypothetical protein